MIIYEKSITATGAQLREAHRERREFEADRYGHNNAPVLNQHWSRVKYMCHADGYVMARRPRCTPFVISEKLWRSFALWQNQVNQ